MVSVLYFAVDSLNGVLNDIEICYALVFLVKVSEMFQEIKPEVICILTGYKEKWFKGQNTYFKKNLYLVFAFSNCYIQKPFCPCSQLE